MIMLQNKQSKELGIKLYLRRWIHKAKEDHYGLYPGQTMILASDKGAFKTYVDKILDFCKLPYPPCGQFYLNRTC